MIRPLLKRIFPAGTGLVRVGSFVRRGCAGAECRPRVRPAHRRADRDGRGARPRRIQRAEEGSDYRRHHPERSDALGTVSSEASKELAESIAGHVPGVTAVHNNLKVGNPQDAQNQPPAEANDASAQQMAENQPGGEDGPMPPPQGYPQQPQDQSQDQAQVPAARPHYVPMQPPSSYPPPQPAYEAPKGPVTIPAGTLLQVRTSESLDSKRARMALPFNSS